jgi:hypothetical protein
MRREEIMVGRIKNESEEMKMLGTKLRGDTKRMRRRKL